MAVASSVAGAPALERAAEPRSAHRGVRARRVPRPRGARRGAGRLAGGARRAPGRARRLHGAARRALPRALPRRGDQRAPLAAAGLPGPARDRAGARLRGEGVRRDRPLRRRRRRHRAGDPPARGRAAGRARPPSEVLAALRPLEHALLPRGGAAVRARRARGRSGEPAPARLGRSCRRTHAPTRDRPWTRLRGPIGRRPIARGGDASEAAPGEVRVRRALLSVSEKRGIVDFARGPGGAGRGDRLHRRHRARARRARAIAVRAIEDFTGFPEIMDGRVKTLHPRLYAGLLARRDDEAHLRAAAEQGIEQVDLVCVNLYPFEQTVARGDASEEEVDREHRHRRPDDDPRGRQEQRVRRGRRRPRRLRARARRAARVRRAGCRCETRKRLAAKAFACTARYDAAISTWFAARTYEGFPPAWSDAYEKVSDLRYGENPHQQAAFYARVGSPTHLLDGRQAAARQGAVVQQPARPQLRARAGRGVRRRRRARSSSTTTPAAAPSARAARRPTNAPSPAIRRAPTAA